jgi:hypothetical protein
MSNRRRILLILTLASLAVIAVAVPLCAIAKCPQPKQNIWNSGGPSGGTGGGTDGGGSAGGGTGGGSSGGGTGGGSSGGGTGGGSSGGGTGGGSSGGSGGGGSSGGGGQSPNCTQLLNAGDAIPPGECGSPSCNDANSAQGTPAETQGMCWDFVIGSGQTCGGFSWYQVPCDDIPGPKCTQCVQERDGPCQVDLLYLGGIPQSQWASLCANIDQDVETLPGGAQVRMGCAGSSPDASGATCTHTQGDLVPGLYGGVNPMVCDEAWPNINETSQCPPGQSLTPAELCTYEQEVLTNLGCATNPSSPLCTTDMSMLAAGCSFP